MACIEPTITNAPARRGVLAKVDQMKRSDYRNLAPFWRAKLMAEAFEAKGNTGRVAKLAGRAVLMLDNEGPCMKKLLALHGKISKEKGSVDRIFLENIEKKIRQKLARAVVAVEKHYETAMARLVGGGGLKDPLILFQIPSAEVHAKDLRNLMDNPALPEELRAEAQYLLERREEARNEIIREYNRDK